MKSDFYKKIISLCLAASVAVGLSACKSKDDESGGNGGENLDKISVSTVDNGQIDMPYDPNSTFNPITCTNLYNLAAADLMFESLFDIDMYGKAVPVLCESYSTDDGIKYTFKIRTGIKFSDGSTFTAADAVSSIVNAKGNLNYQKRFSSIAGISATSSDTFAVTLSYANYRFPSLLDIKVVKDGTFSVKAPTGTGPYVYSASPEPRLVKNANYRDSSYHFTDSIRLVNLSENDFTSSFESGAVDIINIDPALGIYKYIKTEYDIKYYSSTTLQYIGFNYDTRVMGDSDVRTAISSLIDRDYIEKTIYSSCIQASSLVFNPRFAAYYDPSWEVGRGYNRERASQLLAKAGVRDYNGDGFYDYPDGNGGYTTFSIKFIVNSENDLKVETAEYITRVLNEAGFKVQLSVMSWEAYLLALSRGNFNMYLAEVGLSPDYNIAPIVERGGSLNYGGLSSTEYSDLVYKYLAAPDEESAVKAAGDLCTAIADKSPIIPIGYKKYAVLSHRKQMDGFTPTLSNIFGR